MGPNDNEADDIDESLFPSKEDYKEVEGFWNTGAEENAKGKPVGSFQAVINDATLERSSSGDRMQIHYELTILAGPSKDVVLNKYDGLGSAKQAEITQQQLRRVGIDPKKITLKTMPANLMPLKGKVVQITCRQKDDFHNIFFNKLVNTQATAAPRAGGTTNSPAAKPPAKKKGF